MTSQPGWDAVYVADEPPPWDIGPPQPVFTRLAEQGLLRGRLLDAGCGTGENTMMAAARGADALGVDVAPAAIAKARGKAAERGSTARFEVADVLDLGRPGQAFDTVVDSGVFHVFDDGDRARYVASLAAVMRPGAICYLMCFSDRQPGTMGPRRVSQDELAAAFRRRLGHRQHHRRDVCDPQLRGCLGSPGLAGRHRAFRGVAMPPGP